VPIDGRHAAIGLRRQKPLARRQLGRDSYRRRYLSALPRAQIGARAATAYRSLPAFAQHCDRVFRLCDGVLRRRCGQNMHSKDIGETGIEALFTAKGLAQVRQVVMPGPAAGSRHPLWRWFSGWPAGFLAIAPPSP
jgi:hypothetical protein